MGGEGKCSLPGSRLFPYNDTVPFRGHRRHPASPFSHHTATPTLPQAPGLAFSVPKDYAALPRWGQDVYGSRSNISYLKIVPKDYAALPRWGQDA